jgi:hypothetical protein
MNSLPPALLLLLLTAWAPMETPPSPEPVVVARIPAAAVSSPRREEGQLAKLVRLFVRARELKENLPTQRFWVRINDQPANPWNTKTGKAMTWKLRDVKKNVCLVGSDDATNAYEGDTALKESLPLLCIKRSGHKAPKGLDPDNFYAGWSGGEIRLSKPVPGRELTSLEIADALAVQEFGEGWRMAEFHDTSLGGWAWWAYWTAAPAEY